MNIHFTNHAQIGMLERGIAASRIVEALRHPDVYFAAHAGLSGCRKRFSDQTLEIIFHEGRKGEYVIITAYYL